MSREWDLRPDAIDLYDDSEFGSVFGSSPEEIINAKNLLFSE